MKRISVLGTLVLAGALTVAVAAQQPPPPQPSVDNLTVEKVKDNLWVIRGGGGNTAVFATAKGLTVVDTKSPGWGQPLLDKIKTHQRQADHDASSTPTRTTITSAATSSMPATVEIIAQENTAKMMPNTSRSPGLRRTENVFKANPGKGLAKRTFKDKLTIGSGADQINLYYFGPAHTGGDAFVEFAGAPRDARRRHVPEQGPADHGQDQRRLGRASTPHGPQGGRRREERRHASSTATRRRRRRRPTCASSRTSCSDFVAHVQAAKKAGKTAADAVKEWTNPAKYKGYSAPIAAARHGLRAGDHGRDEVRPRRSRSRTRKGTSAI